MKKIYALVDCNNFFASCERVFNPKLQNKPIVVLSNNDGIVVARSNESKKLGIPMGAPYFKVENDIKRHNIQVFSSNYELYGDMSSRVLKELLQYTPNVEPYSIDESFLDLGSLRTADLDSYGRRICTSIFRNTGIPVSVGIAKTKTLAKIATEVAKKDEILDGVLDISSSYPKVIDEYLSRIEIGDVWGIGRRSVTKLQLLGIYTALDLKNMNLKQAKKLLTVSGQRTVMELNGISCISLDENPEPKKNIASTRSFGRPVTTYDELSQSISSHISNATHKLREQDSKAYFITVFIHTSRFKKKDFYYNTVTLTLPQASSYTPEMTTLALKGLKQIFRKNKLYKKAGIILGGITQDCDYQYSVFGGFDEKHEQNNTKLMDTIDNLNKRYGTGTLKPLSEGLRKPWKMKRELLSQRFTTNWDELLTINI